MRRLNTLIVLEHLIEYSKSFFNCYFFLNIINAKLVKHINIEFCSWSDDKSTMRSIASYVSEWKELGARLIGGCCRVLPEDIRAIADAVFRST